MSNHSMSLDEIEELYGKKQADKLLFIAENGQSFGRDSVEYYETRYGDTDDSDNYIGTTTAGPDDEYRSIKALRVIERQYKKLTKVDCFLDPQNGDMRPVPEMWSDAKTKKLFQINSTKNLKSATQKLNPRRGNQMLLLEELEGLEPEECCTFLR